MPLPLTETSLITVPVRVHRLFYRFNKNQLENSLCRISKRWLNIINTMVFSPNSPIMN